MNDGHKWALKQLELLIKENDGNQNEVARMIGMNAGAISALRRGVYRANPTAQLDKLEAYFRTREAAVELPSYASNPDYVRTSTSDSVYHIIRACQLQGGLSLAFGDAGVGKTKASLQFRKDNPDQSIYITSNSCLSSIKEVLISICIELGLPTEGTQGRLFRSIYQKLRDGMVIIIDEAQYLSKGALNTLRAWPDAFLMDNRTLGIAFVGNYELLSKFANDKQEYQQLRNRQKAPLRPFLAANVQQEDITLLFPAVSEERSAQLLLAVARSPQAVRGAVNLYNNALNNENTTYEGLVAMCKAMGITRI